jgi:hypothetical protein
VSRVRRCDGEQFDPALQPMPGAQGGVSDPDQVIAVQMADRPGEPNGLARARQVEDDLPALGGTGPERCRRCRQGGNLVGDLLEGPGSEPSWRQGATPPFCSGQRDQLIPLQVKPEQPLSDLPSFQPAQLRRDLKETIRFVGIGIDRFRQPGHDLMYSTKDIRDLAKALKSKYKDRIIIDTLFNENVTREKVRALKSKLMKSTVNDKVILSYSGHGLLNKEYDYFLSTYEVDFDNPGTKGLAYTELQSLLDGIPARKKLILLDACHSGEVDKEDGIRQNNIADSLGLKKGMIRKTESGSQVGLSNSFELMQSLFSDVGNDTGAEVISAASGSQFALERGDLKNGVFTFSILEAIKAHSHMKISELKKLVVERVLQLTGGLQRPTFRSENVASDWELW